MINKEPGPPRGEAAGMTLIVKTITRLTGGLVFVYGIYIVFQGHKGPGGGVAGGIIIALSLIQLMLAFGRKTAMKYISKETGLLLMSSAATVFLLLSACGYFNIFRTAAGQLRDLATALMVGVGIFVAFSALALAAEERKQK